MDDDGLIHRCLLCAEDARRPDGQNFAWWKFAPLKRSLPNMICHALDYHHVAAGMMRQRVRKPWVFRSPSNDGYVHVVMPMFVQW